ncbi:hypothetical protein MUP01_07875 [Candidatus Bathyarchaeota archaeon]|nr:hypothetical protein [Candidatus Bathyarchaeota archaeon]
MKTLTAIKNLDFSFENSTARIIANRSCPEIKLAGLSVGPFEEGNEYETYYWVAFELDRSGIAHFREGESMNISKLSKTQWTERVQATGQIPRLPDEFYPKLRRCLSESKRNSAKIPEKMLEYEKAMHLTRDIINSRLRKIVSIASAPAQTEQVLKNFSKEERLLYDQLYVLISEWRTSILEYEEVEK